MTNRAAEAYRRAGAEAGEGRRGQARRVSQGEQGEPSAAFLADASRLLAGSLDYEETLQAVAGRALPHLGAWCIVDIVEGEGEERSIRRLAIVHPDPEKQRIARELEESWPPDKEDPIGAPVVIRTREPEVVPCVEDAMLQEAAGSEKNLQRLRALGIGSFVVVPLVARDRVLGAMTFVAPEEGEQYTEDHLELAEDLAARCALAIDNARHYRDAERARKEAEETRREAERASRAKSEFLAVMSHELRTPLNAIMGYTDLLELGVPEPIPEDSREQVERIDTSARHLLRIIEEILTFSKMEAGRLEIEPESVDAGELIREVAGLMKPLAEEKDLDFHVHTPEGQVEIRTDPGKVHQILLNLLSNAVNFTDEGEVRLETETANDELLFRVTDTGVGIPPEEQERIFESFSQIDDALTREVGGTGLGLAVSRELARLLGGDIAVESTPGEGSTFTVELPVRIEA